MNQYLDILRDVLHHGVEKSDRTGTGTYSKFGVQTRYDLTKGFPAVTTKKLYWKGVVAELIWFLKGETNVKWLQEQGVHIWDEWADPNGDLGPIYGKQWRNWSATNPDSHYIHQIDQLDKVIQTLKTYPDSRRMIVTAWNPADLGWMKLEPCHVMFQFYVAEGKLSCQVYQRSADLFLGVPFNIASYALLTHMIAQVTELQVGELIHTLGDAHIYKNHVNQVIGQIIREPMRLPTLRLNPEIKNIDDFKIEDCILEDYNHHPPILAPIAI